MKITIRQEEEKDYAYVENMTREAFWDVYQPGASEHFVLHKLRKSDCFIPELDFVAEHEGKIVGHVISTRAKVVDAQGEAHEILCLGPICASPEVQRQGIGSQLMEHTKNVARQMGFKAIALLGNPAYYHRFGFVNAAQFHITTHEGVNFDSFMILELTAGNLIGISGKFYEDPVFFVTEEETEEFDKAFPHKEKHVTDTQLSV
jgi:acetyltransferase